MLRDEIADQLIYATTRITGINGVKRWHGTGFFMINTREDNTEKRVLVTNRHVVREAESIIVHLVLTNPDGTPDDKNHLDLQINDVQSICEYHPEDDIDICLINFGCLPSNELNKWGNIYYKCISTKMIVSQEGFQSLTPIEDVIMIGYPNAIMDDVNYKPVVRSGITATDLKNDYNGKPEFLIDVACFPGSSGSPVFLHKQGLAQENTDSNIKIAIKPSYAFLGILHAGPTISVDGKIVIKEVPTNAIPVAEMNTMMNLGYVIKASKVLEMF